MLAVVLVSNAGLPFATRVIGDSAYVGYRLLGAAVAAWFVLFRPRFVLPIMRREYGILLLLGWSATTILWSGSPADTFNAVVQLSSVLIVAAYVATAFSAREACRLFGVALTAASTISLALLLAVPSVGYLVVLHPTEGLARQAVGIFGWNSELGFAAASGALMMFASAAFDRSWRDAGLGLLNVVAVLASDSATSLFALAVGLAALLYALGKLSRAAVVAGVSALGITVAAVGIAGLEAWALRVVNRSANLTGRSDIWDTTIRLIQDRPFVGHGFGTNPDFLAYLGREVDHAHNGYLQIAYDRGYVGAVLLACVLVGAVVAMLRGPRNHKLFVLPATASILVANYANNYTTAGGAAAFLLFWAIYSTRRLVETSFRKKPGQGVGEPVGSPPPTSIRAGRLQRH